MHTGVNGWILEVLVEVLKPARERHHPIQSRVEASMRLVKRWLIEAMFTADSAWIVPNPARAMGGSPRSPEILTIRTDSVCHAANGLLGVLDLLGDDSRLTLSDRLFRPPPRAQGRAVVPGSDD